MQAALAQGLPGVRTGIARQGRETVQAIIIQGEQNLAMIRALPCHLR
ncbi:hypothetical protein [Accumulibacter sp.]|nr:hypothetical protein [Accumulibacter sp.]MCM8579348.1 hypothetical protein [Accumulibacter sp.]HMW54128.1 hypothetical protein [Accumulibacter sp.]